MTQLNKDVEQRFDERFPPITPHYTLGDPNYPCYRLTGHEYDSYGKCKICYNLSPELRRKLESENEESEYLKEMKQFLAQELALAKEEGAREARERINKYGRKYNKYPNRMEKSRHRYHVGINKKFEKCALCAGEDFNEKH